MFQELIFRAPLPIKLFLSRAKTSLNLSKRKAIESINSCASEDFKKLNDVDYKKNLKNFLTTFNFSVEQTKNYIDHLYYDKLKLLHQGTFVSENVTIICVIKNEANKLKKFFEHYSDLGDFNYIFIDNGSEDKSVELIKNNGGTVYLAPYPFETFRKIAWINKVYTTIPNGSWTLLLDADELLVYSGYETTSFKEVISLFEKNKINAAGAVMIDMFSVEKTDDEHYHEKYLYFENNFHEEKSFYCRSVYGGIREREFKYHKGRIFLIKKHPLIKKDEKTMLIHCHYNYPYKKNFDSSLYFGLLHYKLFDSELKKYEKIAKEGGYANGSVEYKSYIEKFSQKSFEEIFAVSENTEKYNGTSSLEKIKCMKDVRRLG